MPGVPAALESGPGSGSCLAGWQVPRRFGVWSVTGRRGRPKGQSLALVSLVRPVQGKFPFGRGGRVLGTLLGAGSRTGTVKGFPAKGPGLFGGNRVPGWVPTAAGFGGRALWWGLSYNGPVSWGAPFWGPNYSGCFWGRLKIGGSWGELLG